MQVSTGGQARVATVCTKYSMTLTAAVTVSVPIIHSGLLAVAVQNCSLLLGPVFEIQAATSKSGNGVGRC